MGSPARNEKLSVFGKAPLSQWCLEEAVTLPRKYRRKPAFQTRSPSFAGSQEVGL
jgi:hypothetical protein